MIPVGGDSWTISTSTDPNIEFAIWVLLRDGLRAGAFDAHPEGDGRLRTAGLTSENWLAWFEQIVRTTSDRENRPAQAAAEMFAGPNAIRRVLLELWPGHILRYEERRERDIAREMERHRALTEEQAEALARRARHNWDDLQRYRPLPPLHFYLVEYVRPVVTECPPASAVIGLVDPHEDDLEDYWALVLEGARRLKEAS